MPTPIPAEFYPLLATLINQTYLDRVEKISAAQVDDASNIIAVGIDGLKKLAIKITDTDIFIKLMGGAKAIDSLKFAAPKKKKNCTKGISCGLGCISAAKVCKKQLNPTQKAQKKQVVDNVKKKASGGKSITSNEASDPPEEQNLSIMSEAEEIMLQASISSFDRPKVKKMEKLGLSEAEAAGVAAYIGNHYRAMNQTFWDPDAEKNITNSFGPEGYALTIARVKAAQSGLSKLPPVTLDNLNASVKKQGPPQALPYSGQLIHGMKLYPSDLEDFAARHEAAAKSGEPVKAGKFMSTGWGEGGEGFFMHNANVEIVVTPKMDGTGQGRLVDQYKNKAFENEVLYGPEARFKVSKVEHIKEIKPSVKVVEKLKNTSDHDDLKHLLDLDLGYYAPGFSPKDVYDFGATSSLAALSKKHGLGKLPGKGATES
jgi:hypothetical protein